MAIPNKYLDRRIVDSVTCKRCSKCRKWMPLSEYWSSPRMKDGLVPSCKDCKKAIGKRYADKKYAALVPLREEIKSYGCINCGYTDSPIPIDFHHVDPSTKESDVSHVIMNVKRWQSEILKCVPLCSNCHRIMEVTGAEIEDVDRHHSEFAEFVRRAFARYGYALQHHLIGV